VGVDCSDQQQQNYALCCTRYDSGSRARNNSTLSGIDGSWSYEDDEGPTCGAFGASGNPGYWLTCGNNAFVARNQGVCGDSGVCDEGSVLFGCDDPELIMQCKPPYSDTNFTNDYDHDLDYTVDTYEDDEETDPWDADHGPGSVANAFYWMNWYHDFLYSLGFTESMKNFQFSNYGRGGIGDDGWVVSSQFNALFTCILLGPVSLSSYTDGEVPVIHLCPLFDEEARMRNPALSADVILHEYQHGVTYRNLGESCSDDSPHVNAMHEGWSDYFPITFFEPLLGEYGPGYESGVRTKRYDLNNYSLRDLCQIGADCESHADGEIWAGALYEMRNRMRHKFHAIDSSKVETYAQRPSDYSVLWGPYLGCGSEKPSMLRERNNLLNMNDYYYNDGGAPDRAVIWRSFASRGMGLSSCVGYCVDNVGDCQCSSPVYIEGVWYCPCDEGNNDGPFVPGLVGNSADEYVVAAYDIPNEARFVENHEYIAPESSSKLGLSDDGEANVVLPFCFPFFGNGCNKYLRVGANGGIKFASSSGNIAASNVNFPTSSSTAPNIAPMWDDWNPGPYSTDSNDVYYQCYYSSDDIGPNEFVKYCIVSWHTIKNYAAPQGETSSFQAILFPTGNIIFRFDEIGDGVSSSNYDITVGLNKGDGSGSVRPYGNINQRAMPFSEGDSVAFIYDPIAGTYRYEVSNSSTWLARKDSSTQLTMSDDSEAYRSLPFDFPFSSAFDTNYSGMMVGTNGGVKFGSSGQIGYINHNLPYEDSGSSDYANGHPHIAALWDDLDVDGDGNGVYHWDSQDDDATAITWWNVWRHGYPSQTYSLQAVLFDTGDVILHYDDLGSLSYGVTVGVNDPRDPNEPNETGDLHTSFASQLGTIGSPEVSDYSTHYYFATERKYY